MIAIEKIEINVELRERKTRKVKWRDSPHCCIPVTPTVIIIIATVIVICIVIIIVVIIVILIVVIIGVLIVVIIVVIMVLTSIMITISGVGTRCVPTPKMAYFSVFKAFLFLKYFKNNLGPIESSFNP